MVKFIINRRIIMSSIIASYYAELRKVQIQIRRKACSIYLKISLKFKRGTSMSRKLQ